MENFLFYLLLDAVDLADRQSALIAVLEIQRDTSLDLAKQAVTQMKSARLNMLADHISTREDFNQDLPDKCVIGIGLKLVGKDAFYPERLSVFADYYGLTPEQVDALFWGQYNDLLSNELNHDKTKLHRVTNEEVVRVLRRLAAK